MVLGTTCYKVFSYNIYCYVSISCSTISYFNAIYNCLVITIEIHISTFCTVNITRSREEVTTSWIRKSKCNGFTSCASLLVDKNITWSCCRKICVENNQVTNLIYCNLISTTRCCIFCRSIFTIRIYLNFTIS